MKNHRLNHHEKLLQGENKAPGRFFIFGSVLGGCLTTWKFSFTSGGHSEKHNACSHGCFIFRNAHFFFSFFWGMIPSNYSLNIIGKEIWKIKLLPMLYTKYGPWLWDYLNWAHVQLHLAWVLILVKPVTKGFALHLTTLQLKSQSKGLFS
jgi:hypothetical protein